MGTGRYDADCGSANCEPLSMTVGDDLLQAAHTIRLRSSQLVVRFQICAPQIDEIELQLNKDTIALEAA